jgi:cytochrome P450
MLDVAAVDAAIVNPKTYADEAALRFVFATLRKEDPVHWTAPKDYRPFWAVTKHADIMEVERQPEFFINEPRSMLFPIEEEQLIWQRTGGRATDVRTLVHMDNPDHRVLRSVTQAWFMPKNLKGLEERLAVLAKTTVDKMERLGGQCDFVKDIAVWYPLHVIMMILGVPPEDEIFMLKLTQEIFASTDPELKRNTDKNALEQTVQEMFAYFGKLTAERRAYPRDDLSSVIANALIDGKPIADLEALSYYVLIATAGHDTTSASMSSGLLGLIQHPDEMAKLRQHPELLPDAINEMIRWATPVRHFFRTATRDYVLRGKKIRAGDGLMMCYPSANQDEEIFDDPHLFKVDRTGSKQLAFGFGPHVCIGQHLARMELRALYTELLARVEHVELAGVTRGVESSFVSGLKNLPIRYQMNKTGSR